MLLAEKLSILSTLITKGESLSIPGANPLHIGSIDDPLIELKAPYKEQGIYSPSSISKLESPKLSN